MLDLEKVNLDSLCQALEDHSDETTWWLDREAGEVEPRFESSDEGDRDEDRLILIEPIPSRESYRDLEDFVSRVRDPRARELLERAIAGRGAFRRFKDMLFEFPDLRKAWFEFHGARMERRALRWLADEGIVDGAVAERAILERGDPDLPELSGAFDLYEIALAVANDLRDLYGDRFHQVLLFGSWARGDAHPESDIDLLVVLDRVESAWEELERMEDILWRHSFENDTVITALPVAEADLLHASSPTLLRARMEGREVA